MDRERPTRVMLARIWRWSRALLRWFCFAVVLAGLGNRLRSRFETSDQQFAAQADSFLAGRLDIDGFTHDTVSFNGKRYWHQGVAPSLLMLPVRAVLGKRIGQGPVQILVLGVLSWLLWRLARSAGFSRGDAWYLLGAFMLGSFVIDLASDPKSYFFAQLIAMTGASGALLEWRGRRRPMIVGILCAATWSTRQVAGLIALAFAFLLMPRPSEFGGARLRAFAAFVAPLAVALGAELILNGLRYGDPFLNGYQINDVGSYYEPLRRIGVFSLHHVPTNVYYYFLRSVEPVRAGTAHLVFPYYTYDVEGLSAFIVAPFFVISLFRPGFGGRKLAPFWLVCGIILSVLMTYYGTGWCQFGPRYLGDLLPILFFLIVTAKITQPLSERIKDLIAFSAALNGYLLLLKDFNL